VHEAKQDGHRLIVQSDGESVRLFIQRGYDWTARYRALGGHGASLEG
jgi:ATP-dependent DNA ligase